MNQSVGRLFVLDLSGGRVFSLNPDDSDSKTLVTGPIAAIRRAATRVACAPSLQFHLGGGAGGIQHFIDHLLPGRARLSAVDTEVALTRYLP
jgi:hypothetical protein